MAREWTIPQKDAMNTRNKTLLVSAAAGSGKTATLTERIIRRITDKNDPADISKMLIVTFTRSAAAELRDRIFAALGKALASTEDKRHISSQIMKIGSAKICTIDSFYLDMIKSNFSLLGIPASFRLADDAEYMILARNAMDESIDEMYEEDPDFSSFCECFTTVRSALKITDTILAFHKKLSNIPEGIEYVAKCSVAAKESADGDFFDTPFGKVLSAETADFFEYYKDIFRSALSYMEQDDQMNTAYGNSFAYDCQYCEKIYNSLSNNSCSYSELQEMLSAYSPIKLGSLKEALKTEECKSFQAARKDFTDKRKKLLEKTYSKSPSVISRSMQDTSRYLDLLYRLLVRFEEKISEIKSRLSIMTFTDVRRHTLRLLTDKNGNPSAVAREYAEQFSDIYIDEYQDVDRVQDLIFKSISKPTNRFMVGDIKQSIYRFRGAEPMLFSEYRRNFPAFNNATDSDCATIFMSDNFRCDKNIIKFTNAVCSTIFSVCPESIGYTKEDDLRFSKRCENENYVSPKVKIALITPPENSDPDEIETDSEARRPWEAAYIAKEIENLLATGKKADGTPILPGDIAILFRSSSAIPSLTAALEAKGILYSLADSDSYFENSDVLLMLSVLNTIDNPERDIYLAGTLKSPLFAFTLDELVAIRRYSPSVYSLYGALCEYSKLDNNLSQKCQEFISTLNIWQADASALSVDRFLRVLFESERFITSGLISQTDARGEGGNLLLLYEYARKFEGSTFKGLYQFVEYLNTIISRGGKLSAEVKAKVEDRVSLMTIHKSKGLEFPVCFICNATGSIRSLETKNSLVYEYPTGIALKIADESGLGRINTPLRSAVISQISYKDLEEEMRILYVALTRARERLYVTATTASSAEKLLEKAAKNARFTNRYTILNKCSSYLDWILLSLADSDDDSYEFLTISEDKIQESVESLPVEEVASYSADTDIVSRFSNAFSFVYPYRELSRVPTKISVSRLYPDILDENDTSLELFTPDRETIPVPEFFSGIHEDAKSAEKGTATHLFFQFCNFARLAEYGVEEELCRLEQMKFLPPNARELMYIDEIEKFVESSLLKNILNAKKVFREQRFNVELPAKLFTANPVLSEKIEGEFLAIQGVIDLVIEDFSGNLFLYDYKTDRLSYNELRDPLLAKQKLNKSHALQLSYYKKAIELLFGKKCTGVSVYSTHSSLLYQIDTLF